MSEVSLKSMEVRFFKLVSACNCSTVGFLSPEMSKDLKVLHLDNDSRHETVVLQPEILSVVDGSCVKRFTVSSFA